MTDVARNRQRAKLRDRLLVVGEANWGPSLDLLVGDGTFREIIGPTIAAQARGLYRIELSTGATTRPLRHHGEAAYYIIDGAGAVATPDGDRQDLREGSMVHVDAGSAYRFSADVPTVLVGGPCPISEPLMEAEECTQESTVGAGVRTFHRDNPGMLVPFISKDARLVVWLGVGARTANMNYVVLEPGERNTEHVHRYSEDTIYIVEGSGTAEDVTNGRKLPVTAGDTVHIPPGIWHAVEADRGAPLVSVGGPCPADLDMLSAAGADVSRYVDDPGAFIAAVGVLP